MTEPKTYTLDVPGAVLHFDVRGPSQTGEADAFAATLREVLTA
jgi:hypothetical protein